MMIPQKVVKALNDQIAMEFSAFWQYNAMAFAFEEMGLPVFAQFFYAQAKEEQGHGMKIAKYLVDQGAPVKLQALKAPKTSFKTAKDICEDFVAHEKAVTESIHKLVALARAEKDTATEVFLNWKVMEQVEEVASATELLEMVAKANTPGQILMLEGRVARMRSE
jgi:ferritin